MFFLKSGTTTLIISNKLKSSSQINILNQIKYFSSADIGRRYPKQFDYKTKRYGVIAQVFDSTLPRLGDNSLIITVDGNFGSGKSEFAKRLAKDIDFLYAKEINFDDMLYKRFGKDVNFRKINNEIVGDNERFRLNTISEWHENPLFKRTIQMQHLYYYCRWWQYRTALLHVFSTGQGVVLERSPFSDSVIAQALYEHNFLSKEAWKFYKNDLLVDTLPELWKPHVVIYLDRKPEDCLKQIKSNGKDYEKTSNVYSLDLLNTVDKLYKKQFIPAYENDLYVLQYDSNDKLLTEDVIGDLESLDLEDLKRFSSWRVKNGNTVDVYRSRLSNDEFCKTVHDNCTGYIHVPEYLLYGEDYVKLREKLEEHPDLTYETGYNNKGINAAFDIFNRKKPNVDWL